ncbi:hypothetical protein [Pedobacter nyackensis]|uniref:Uncharacterized protein n=1 Tax=Pedobacter nyackensis TaxID=475255 RepID=A0A1W2AR78_9SPHI|nr:hypothetical protein [Pedobacter nyackensis]SMC62708.1 hypothetical protein SAMN04488101_101835 [Pedobacter nyackensis]
MRYHLYILFTMLIIGCVNGAYAAKTRNLSTALHILQQDTLGTARRQEKGAVEKDKKETLAQTEKALKKVPKAKNKVIPRTIGPTSINVKSPRINQVKVKVNTQVKIKL